MPSAERRPKSEVRIHSGACDWAPIFIRDSVFGFLSAFGLRISAFSHMISPIPILVQTALLLVLAPLVTGCIRNWKAKLQNRRGARIWQPYLDLAKFLRKDMVISEHASWI